MCELISAATMSSMFGTSMPAFTVMNAISGVSIIMGAFGAARQSKAQEQQAQYQAQIARRNQAIAEQNAMFAEMQGRDVAAQEREKAEQLKSRQMVSLISQGVDPTAGSSVDLLADTVSGSLRDQDIIAKNVASQTRAIRQQGAQQGAQANLFQMRADAESPFLAGTTAFLGGMAPIASKWYSNKPAQNPYAPSRSSGFVAQPGFPF